MEDELQKQPNKPPVRHNIPQETEEIAENNTEFTVIITEFSNPEVFKNREYLYDVMKAIGAGELTTFVARNGSIVVVFEKEEERISFMKSEKTKKAFGEEAKITLGKTRNTEAMLFGVGDWYSEEFVKKKVLATTGITGMTFFGKGKRKWARLAFNSEKELATALKKSPIKIGYRLLELTLPVRKKTSQCCKCGKLDHRVKDCTRKRANCARCGGFHNKEKCKAKYPTCINCKENHHFTSAACPAKAENMKKERDDTTTAFCKKWKIPKMKQSSIQSRMQRDIKRIYENELKVLKKKMRKDSHVELSKFSREYISPLFAGHPTKLSISSSHNPP